MKRHIVMVIGLAATILLASGLLTYGEMGEEEKYWLEAEELRKDVLRLCDPFRRPDEEFSVEARRQKLECEYAMKAYLERPAPRLQVLPKKAAKPPTPAVRYYAPDQTWEGVPPTRDEVPWEYEEPPMYESEYLLSEYELTLGGLYPPPPPGGGINPYLDKSDLGGSEEGAVYCYPSFGGMAVCE